MDFSFTFIWHFETLSVVGDKKNFLKNLSQNFGKIALGGVVNSERKIKRVWETSQQAKSSAVVRQKTDDFTERVPTSYAC